MKIYKYSNIEGMARIGYIQNVYEIYVNTDDGGDIPHFHLRLKTDWSKFHTCICLNKAEYFHHTGKEDVSSSKMKKDLQSFLSERNRHFSNISNWKYACILWNDNNSNVEIDLDNTSMPDYIELR